MHVSFRWQFNAFLSLSPPPAQIFSFSSPEWLRTAADTLPQTYKCKENPEAWLYLSFVPTVVGCEGWKQSSPLLCQDCAVIVVPTVLSCGGDPGIPGTERGETGSKTQGKPWTFSKGVQQINKRGMIFVVSILQWEKQEPGQWHQRKPENLWLVGPSWLLWYHWFLLKHLLPLQWMAAAPS